MSEAINSVQIFRDLITSNPSLGETELSVSGGTETLAELVSRAERGQGWAIDALVYHAARNNGGLKDALSEHVERAELGFNLQDIFYFLYEAAQNAGFKYDTESENYIDSIKPDGYEETASIAESDMQVAETSANEVSADDLNLAQLEEAVKPSDQDALISASSPIAEEDSGIGEEFETASEDTVSATDVIKQSEIVVPNDPVPETEKQTGLPTEFSEKAAQTSDYTVTVTAPRPTIPSENGRLADAVLEFEQTEVGKYEMVSSYAVDDANGVIYNNERSLVALNILPLSGDPYTIFWKPDIEENYLASTFANSVIGIQGAIDYINDIERQSDQERLKRLGQEMRFDDFAPS